MKKVLIMSIVLCSALPAWGAEAAKVINPIALGGSMMNDNKLDQFKAYLQIIFDSPDATQKPYVLGGASLLHHITGPNAGALLLEKGLNIEALDVHGQTPLISTARKGQINAVKFLVEKGANLNAKTPKGTDAYAAAVSARDSAQKIRDNFRKMTPKGNPVAEKAFDDLDATVKFLEEEKAKRERAKESAPGGPAFAASRSKKHKSRTA